MYDHHIKAADTRNCDLPVAVLKELLTQNIPEATTSQEQIPSSSSADSSLRNIQQSSQPSTFLIDSHARNISYLPNEVVIPLQHDIIPVFFQFRCFFFLSK